ncbi:MAG: hypothetical protein HY320_06335 [Armatimonadetes bacterium]|nr:hypothetical protein [Armatimonadota bacterium]
MMSLRPPSGRRRFQIRWLLFILALAFATAAGLVHSDTPGGHPVADGDHALTLADPWLWDHPLTRYWSVRVPERPFDYPRSLRRDRKFGQDYPYQTWGLVWESPQAVKTRRIFVHYQHREDEYLARQATAALARLYWVAREYLGREPVSRGSGDRDPQVHVWMTRDGEAGGEEFQGHLYLYAVQEPRAPAEWLREIAHEYAHAILPRIGPYHEGEPWASGYLGERLLLKWLIDNGETAAWGERFSGPDYMANQIAPLRDRYLNSGPHAASLVQMDAAGMEQLIGFALAIEAAYGPRLLREALARLGAEEHPGAFVRSVGEALTAQQPDTILLDACAFIPARSPGAVQQPDGGWRFERVAYWVYLPPGEWEISVDGTAPALLQLERVALTRDAPAGTFRGRVEVGAWRRLDLAASVRGTMVLRRVRFQRRAPDADS